MASVTTVLPIISNPPVGAIQGARVTLVRPAMIHSAKTYSLSITPPLGLAYLAAMLLEAGHEVTAVDAMAEGKDNRRVVDGFAIVGLSIDETVARIHPDSAVIGISCMFSQDWTWSRQLIRAVRRRFPHAVIVAGGEHITALPEYSLRDCRELDACVLGEGEETLTELVRAGSDRAAWREVPGLAFLVGEQFVRSASRSRIREVDDIPRPAWDLFPMSVYLNPWNSMGVYRGRTMGILGTRGCPFKCTFCSNLQMYGQTWVARDVDAVLDEIQHYIDAYGAENFEFYDLTMIIRKAWILEFCRKLDERGMKIVWQLPVGTRSETIDAEVAAALYRTGCRNIVYAPESGSNDTLKIIKKQVHLDRLVTSIGQALSSRLVVRVNMILGFPHETRRHLWDSVLFAWRLAWIGVHDLCVYVFSPYPGTDLFRELCETKTIPAIDDNYFSSLVVMQDVLTPTNYCRQVSGRELFLWRVFTTVTFYGLSFLRRPSRFFKLAWNIARNRCETTLEFRLGTILRGHQTKEAASALPTPSVAAGS